MSLSIKKSSTITSFFVRISFGSTTSENSLGCIRGNSKCLNKSSPSTSRFLTPSAITPASSHLLATHRSKAWNSVVPAMRNDDRLTVKGELQIVFNIDKRIARSNCAGVVLNHLPASPLEAYSGTLSRRNFRRLLAI